MHEWPEEEIETWDSFVKLVERIVPFKDFYSLGESQQLFRGQSNSDWDLTPSFYRQFKKDRSIHPEVWIAWEPPADVLQLEKELILPFARDAHNYIPSNLCPEVSTEDDFLKNRWFSIIQQHGGITPLLDWTYSPFVALYFCVAQDWEHDGAVWTFDPSNFCSEYTNITELRKKAEPFMVMIDPFYRLPRFTVQKAAFTYSTMHSQDAFVGQYYQTQLKDMATQAPQNYQDIFLKLRVSKNLKPEILRRLHMMNIDGQTLFPGLDGLGRRSREEIMLRTAGLGLHPSQPPEIDLGVKHR